MRAWRITAVVTLLLWAQGAAAGTLLVLGDSISAAFGLDTRQGWVSLLEQRLGPRVLTTRWSMHRSVATPAQAAWRACRRCLQSIARTC